MIQRIEYFGAELQIEMFAQSESFIRRKVQRDHSRPDQRVSSQVSIITGGWQCKRRRVKVFIWPTKDRIVAVARHQIGPLRRTPRLKTRPRLIETDHNREWIA